MEKSNFMLLAFLIFYLAFLSPTFGQDFATPMAIFSVNISSGNAPLSVEFIDQSTGDNLTYRWDFGDGSSSEVREPVHLFELPGEYLVLLEVTNAIGSANISHQIDVFPSSGSKPVANFSANTSQGCIPLAVQFTGQSIGENLTYQWDFGDGTVSEIQNPIKIFTLIGNFTVTLNLSNSDGFDVREQIIVVKATDATVIAGFQANRTMGSVPFSVLFDDSSLGNNLSHFWEFGDNTTSTEQSPIHQYSIPGIYTACLRVVGDENSDWENKTGYIIATSSDIEVNFTANKSIGRVPISVQFQDTSKGEILSYFWDFGDGNISAGANPVHEYSSAGKYNVSHRIDLSGNFSVWENRTEYVRVYPFDPEVDFAADNEYGYAPLTTGFFAISSIEGILHWEWDFGDGTTGSGENPDYTYTEEGTYTVILNISTVNDTFSGIKQDMIIVVEDTREHRENGEESSIEAAITPVPPNLVSVPVESTEGNTTESITYALDFSRLKIFTTDSGGYRATLLLDTLDDEGVILSKNGSTVNLSYPQYEIRLCYENAVEKDDRLDAKIKSLTMNSSPMSSPLFDGNFSVSFITELLSVSQDSKIDGSLVVDLPAALQAEFQKAAAVEGYNITHIAGAAHYRKDDLDTGPAKVTVSVPISWMEQIGKEDIIKVVRVNDEGIGTLLKTQLVGRGGGQVLFQAESPEGLSWFGLISISRQISDQNLTLFKSAKNHSSYLNTIQDKIGYIGLIIVLCAGIGAIIYYLKMTAP